MAADSDVIVIGGGLAGLSCARELCAHRLGCQLLEASDAVGGRVRTDELDGFRLDRGFQVFLTAYPEAKAILDYEALNLRDFEPGALIRIDDSFHRFADPWRRPQHLLATATSSAATLMDKLRVAQFRRSTTRGELQKVYERPEQATIDLLRQRGFSEVIIERFFRPFLGGVFLDHALETSSRMCEFVFRMFSLGNAALPEAGMGTIPAQVVGQLPPDAVRLNTPVASLEEGAVVLADGQRLTARAIVIAAEAPAARRLLGDTSIVKGQRTSCLYFAATVPPVHEPILVLNGTGDGPINNLCVPSQVSSKYAPPGESLISVTVLEEHAGAERLLQQVQDQLQAWYGPSATSWRHLRTYDIEYALPSQAPPALEPVQKPSVSVRDGVFLCGDYLDTASINGAMASGRRAAQAVMEYLSAG